ncbi:hypothetical protein QBC35DRAFT_271654 [Podospora australis]|uniref:Uncharacterized protein n=1 Tax=Podospora australis TaxID=1536484 RepID=A0AAN7AGH9_9PEZI|nr:hypothetical protein QBC35DRAFT_271654 [Podospora australis]
MPQFLYLYGPTTAMAVAHIALAALWVVPLAALWCITFWLGRRRDDRARIGVSWLKAAYPFWILSTALQALQAGLVVYWTTSNDREHVRDIARISATIFQVARYSQHIADILLFITFVELGNGFTLCINGGKPTRHRRTFRYAAFSWGAVLLLMATVFFASRVPADNLGAWDGIFPHREAIEEYTGVLMAILILLCLTSFPMVGFASYIVHRARKHILLDRSASILLAASILNSIRLFVTMVVYLDHWRMTRDFQVRGYSDLEDSWASIAEAFFNFVFMFVVFTLLFVLVIRKRKGLWSNVQPYWDAPAKLNPVTSPVTPTTNATSSEEAEVGLQGQPQQLSLPVDHQPSPPPNTLHVDITQLPETVYQHHRARISPYQETPASSSRSPDHQSPYPASPSSSAGMRRIRTLQELESEKVLLPSPQAAPTPSRSGPREQSPPLPLPSPTPPSPIEEPTDVGVADGFQMQNLDPAPPGYDEANTAPGWTKEDGNNVSGS